MKNEIETEVKKHKKTLSGVIVKKSGDKSVVVEVERKLKHAKYKKFILRTKKYHAHDEANQYVVGDKVTIIESKPISKLKRWTALKA